jgi:hypothetical protein
MLFFTPALLFEDGDSGNLARSLLTPIGSGLNEFPDTERVDPAHGSLGVGASRRRRVHRETPSRLRWAQRAV